MARAAPVTLDDVEATLRTIEGAGIKPTVRLVHQKLGRGSLSTITAHLRTVAASRAETDVGALPDPVLAGLRGMADTLWLECADAADARIAAVASAADARVRDALAERETALAQLADIRDERGGLVATVATRDARVTDLERLCEEQSAALARAERTAALAERDHGALVVRLTDRDAELQRAVDARERSDAALSAVTAERTRLAATLELETARRDAEIAAQAAELDAVRRHLGAARTDAATLATDRARLEARLDAHTDQAAEFAARHAALECDRDRTAERASVLDARLERTRQALTESEHAAQLAHRTALALHEHADGLVAQLRAAGVPVTNIASPPPTLTSDPSVPDARAQAVASAPLDASQEDLPSS